MEEIIVKTYKAIGRSVINYAAPVWTPSLSKTNRNGLETTQNAVLRVATGCVKMIATLTLTRKRIFSRLRNTVKCSLTSIYTPGTVQSTQTNNSCRLPYNPGTRGSQSLKTYPS